jgi:hypothetical protein
MKLKKKAWALMRYEDIHLKKEVKRKKRKLDYICIFLSTRVNPRTTKQNYMHARTHEVESAIPSHHAQLCFVNLLFVVFVGGKGKGEEEQIS